MLSKVEFEIVSSLRHTALFGTSALLEVIVPHKDLNTKFKNFNGKNAKRYFLMQALIEAEKVGFAMNDWIEYAQSDQETTLQNAPSGSRGMKLQTFIDEQSLRRRKLAECLMSLISFSETNHIQHYFLYLLYEELKDMKRLLCDQKDYFNCPSAITEYTIEHLKRRIEEVEKKSSVDLGKKPWYKSGTHSARFKHALQHASPNEITWLAYTYRKGYSDPSSNIHFSPAQDDIDDLVSRFTLGICQSGLLATGIFIRARDLLRVKPEGVYGEFPTLSQRDVFTNSPVAGKASIGDMVVVDGSFIGEVFEVKSSSVGYECYRVKFLDKPPSRSIAEDWITALNLQVLLSKVDMDGTMGKELEKQLVSIGKCFPKTSKTDAIKRSVIWLWRQGLFVKTAVNTGDGKS